MQTSDAVIVSDSRYRVLHHEGSLVFERPAETASPLSAWIPWGLGGMATLVGLSLLAQSVTDPKGGGDPRTAALGLFVLSALAFAVGRRAYLRLRIDRPRARLRLRLDAASLTDERGEVLAQRAQLHIRTRIDWTDGMGGFRLARVVSLRWPQGEVPIFRSYDKKLVQALTQELAQQGLGSTAR